MKISLQTITLYNFKSYLGEVIIGPLYPFMAIIGPNGSGKSNIVDAIRFALGEVLSALRVKRFSELVHGDLIEKTKTESIYVTLTFLVDNNKEKHFTRMIQGEETQYKIDNEIVTSEFYITTLQEYGLNIKSEHFVISQGNIECIVTKTPNELNKIFEQISGSYVYKPEYKRLKLKLTQMENKIQFTQHVKKQLLMNKKYITIQKEEAKKYLKLQEQYREEKLQYQLIRLLIIKRIVETLQNENSNIKSRKKECLRNKRNATIELKGEKLQFKALSDSLENVEQRIVELENVIQEQKIQYTVLKENISYWQKKRDCACISLENANLAHDTNKKTIEELKDELKYIDKKLVEFKNVSEQSVIELSDSQVKQYFELKNTVECKAKDFVKQMNSLICDQEVDRDHLDNEIRRQQELEDKMKRTVLIEENLKTRLKKLQNAMAESSLMLMEKAMKKQELYDKITQTNNKSLSLKDDIAKMVEELNELDVDNYTISRQREKAEMIKMLKQSYPGVHNRLSKLCKPVHPRYKIAVTKVFGRFMDAIVVDTTKTAMQCIDFLKLQKLGVETFLPLDSLQPEVLKKKLRDIGRPNAKLLYDILNISSPQIDKAILFVTKNTLVCETPEDARRMAYEIDRQTHNCVSLDGSFYRKDGIMSGGMANLMNKAKQWEEQDIITLQEQKNQLKKKFQDLPNVSLLQSEFNVYHAQFKELSLKNKFIEKDFKNIEDEITRIHKESIEYNTKLSLSNKTISKIQCDMQTRDKELEDVEKYVSAVKDTVFVDFCKNINVPDINYYEKNHLRTYQEQQKKQIELENQYDLIRNQLRFEIDRNMEDNILNWLRVVEHADTRLSEINQQEHSIRKAIEQEEEKFLKLLKDCAIAKENIVGVEKEMDKTKSRIDINAKLYLATRKAGIIVQRKIEQQKTECDNILKECKMENITIPILERFASKFDSSSSSSFTDSSIDWDMSKSKIDFSQFSKSISESTEENLQGMVKQLSENLKEIQNELEAIANPNFKAQENMDSTIKQIQEINDELKKLHEETTRINKQFETIKMKRFSLFSECLDCVTTEIDYIYKSLVNHTSASAFILPDNPEEPYEGGIIYSCIAASKRFQPLENLSGGEKTLAGLALLFAFQRFKPAPFFIMDECDAALDNMNIKNIVHFIQSQTHTTQFIIISLQKLLYFCSDGLIGVISEPDVEYTQSKVFAISLMGYKDKKEYKNKPDENMDEM